MAGLGVSLSAFSQEKQENPVEKEPQQAEIKINDHLFTEDQLIAAWTSFAEKLNEEKLLKNTMMLYKPKMLSNSVFEVEVSTEINKHYLEDHGASILSFLRQQLLNDDITMTIKISEGIGVKKPLTSREIFEELAQQNPALQKLSDEFDLELS